MVQIAAASHFWAAVQDCLVTFHQFEPREAAEKVTSLWRRLPSAANGSDFSEMIYHAEPWQIACMQITTTCCYSPNLRVRS